MWVLLSVQCVCFTLELVLPVPLNTQISNVRKSNEVLSLGVLGLELPCQKINTCGKNVVF